jgi:hypothetical protein
MLKLKRTKIIEGIFFENILNPIQEYLVHEYMRTVIIGIMSKSSQIFNINK